MTGKHSRTTPEGTRDLLFEGGRLARREVARRLADLFCSRGYAEVMTPGLEYYDMFAGEMAGMPQQSLHKLCDNHGRLLVMSAGQHHAHRPPGRRAAQGCAPAVAALLCPDGLPRYPLDQRAQRRKVMQSGI